jgi:hypothetical protein
MDKAFKVNALRYAANNYKRLIQKEDFIKLCTKHGHIAVKVMQIASKIPIKVPIGIYPHKTTPKRQTIDLEPDCHISYSTKSTLDISFGSMFTDC